MMVIEKNRLDVELISPKHGPKYSPNLYRWLKDPEHNHRAWTSRVFRDANDVLWIGIYDASLRELSGSRLMGVLCNGAKEESAAWQRVVATEIEGFWNSYLASGRCAIDVAHEMHFVDDKTRWLINGDSRSCTWCGNAKQVMKRWEETVQRAEWTSAQLNPKIENRSCNKPS